MDGNALPGAALTYVIRNFPQIEAFKIIQEKISRITVQLVLKDNNKVELERMIEEQFKRRLGQACEIDFEYLPKIEREPSGKFRYIVNKLKQSR